MKKFISIILCFVLMSSIPAFGADELKFSDVDSSTAMGKAIYKLAENGIVNGNGDGTFAPNRPVKRAELCKMVNNIWAYTEEGSDTFSDVTETDWYFCHVKIAKKAGFINGYEDGTFRGEAYVTREQACAILVRVAKLYDLGLPVVISDAVSPWAETYVKTVIANTFIDLEEGGTFRATEAMTRGELALLLDDFVIKTPEQPANPDGDKKDEISGNGSSITINPGSSNSGSTRPGSTRPGSSSGDDEEDNNYYPGEEEPTKPEEKFDEAKQKEVVENLNALLEELDIVAGLPWITFTEKENAILDVIKATVNKTLADAEKGEWVYVEDYVYKTYKSDVEFVRSECKKMEETGEYEAFKTKLKELPIYLLEYLSETMFGVDVEEYM
ncbi:MAG: S-layer homology domain-containing protein [Clostridia bacterium]|nr:S-layer homology domain-containing protein [Clostridia bacterium]